MCQLIMYRSLIKEPMSPLMLNLMLKDTGFRNKDGAGLYSESVGINKTEKAFNTISWRNFFLSNKNKTIIGHVRAATTSKSGKKEISADNSHPYQIDEVVLAHNGSLSTKAGYNPNGTVDEEATDSLNFFRDVMHTKKKKDIPVIEALKETMKNYTGKFAFLIFDGVDYYAVRGKTATLFKSTVLADGKPIAVFINTEETELKEAMALAVHYYALYYDASVDYKIEALEKETIYKLEGLDLNKVGEIQENDLPVAQRSMIVYDYDDHWPNRGKFSSGAINTVTSKFTTMHFFSVAVRDSLDTLIRLKIKPETFDRWAIATIGKSATCLDADEITTLVDFIDIFYGWCNTKEEIVADYFENNTKIHQLVTEIRKNKLKHAVQWPFELNTLVDLENILKGDLQ